MMDGKKGHSGFKVPDGYFEQFEARLAGRLKASGDELIPKEAGFRVPEDYFETFGQRLQQRLETPRGRTRNLWSGYLGWAAAAAAGIALALLLWPSQSPQEPAFDDLARTEIESYLEIRYEDLSAYELAESLPLGNMAMGDLLEEAPVDTQILDYLDRENEAYDDYYLSNDE